jgi:MinD superfamily P-loop ATPase
MSSTASELVILSGKGGTGKTAVAAALAHLAHADAVATVLVDADVDAANLELVLGPEPGSSPSAAPPAASARRSVASGQSVRPMRGIAM